jgi:hypothetical protein
MTHAIEQALWRRGRSLLLHDGVRHNNDELTRHTLCTQSPACLPRCSTSSSLGRHACHGSSRSDVAYATSACRDPHAKPQAWFPSWWGRSILHRRTFTTIRSSFDRRWAQLTLSVPLAPLRLTVLAVPNDSLLCRILTDLPVSAIVRANQLCTYGWQ